MSGMLNLHPLWLTCMDDFVSRVTQEILSSAIYKVVKRSLRCTVEAQLAARLVVQVLVCGSAGIGVGFEISSIDMMMIENFA